jgi:hypothetical protein
MQNLNALPEWDRVFGGAGQLSLSRFLSVAMNEAYLCVDSTHKSQSGSEQIQLNRRRNWLAPRR